jgi:hypothetical protein
MADVTIQVPPPSGSLSLNVGDNLYIEAKKDINFCCSIGANFSPNISSLTFNKDTTNGPYNAVTAGTGKYNTSDKDKTCDPNAPSPILNAQSVQINPPPPRPRPK